MRLLVFYPYVPYPLDRGTHHRTFNLLRELASEHEIDLLALAQNGEGMEHQSLFEEFCRNVRFISFQHPAWQKLFPQRLFNRLPANVAHWTVPEVGEALERQLQNNRYDAVHACDIILAQYFFGNALPLVIDRSRVDLQYQLMEHRNLKFKLRDRVLRCEGYLKLWFYERAVARRAAMEVVCGPDDEAFLRRYVRRKMTIAVVGNGVDLEFFYPTANHEKRAAEPTVLFCGAMDYNPNMDALRWFFAEIFAPLRELVPALRVLIVGKNPTAEIQAFGQRPGVTVTGSVPDVRPYYRRAWLQMVPLRIGGGTRLKIVESLAIGTPVVSTTIGAQGLGLVHDREILLADSAATFAAEIARALRDSALRSRLEENGGEVARARFSWKSLGKELISVYAEQFRAAANAPPPKETAAI